MLTALLAVTAAALLYPGIKYILLLRDLGRMEADIRRIRNQDSNQQLRVSSPDRRVGALANAVNDLFRDVHRVKADQVRAVDELHQSMASISHDLRTPLTSIAGYLRLLEDPGTTGEQRESYLGVARSKADSLGELVSGLFTLARLDAGGYPFQMEQVDVGEVLSEELAAFYPAFAQRGQEPQLDLYEGPLPTVGDRGALERVFANLLQNMVQHQARDIRISSTLEGDRIVLRFSNRAPGLTESDVSRLFQRFFTSDPTRSGESTGLGLAIVKEFVENMDGTIAAELDGGRLTFVLVWRRRGH